MGCKAQAHKPQTVGSGVAVVGRPLPPPHARRTSLLTPVPTHVQPVAASPCQHSRQQPRKSRCRAVPSFREARADQLSGPQLTQRLSDAVTVSQLTALLQQHELPVEPAHIGAALKRAVALTNGRTSPQSSAAQPEDPQFDSQEVSELVAWCAQALGATNSSNDSSAAGAGLLAACGLRELASIAKALAQLDVAHSLAEPILQALHDDSNRPAPRISRQRKQHDSYAATALALNQGPWAEPRRVGAASNGAPGSTRQATGRAAARGSARYEPAAFADASPQALADILWALARWFPDAGVEAADDSAAPQHTAQQPVAPQQAPQGFPHAEELSAGWGAGWGVAPAASTPPPPTPTPTRTPRRRRGSAPTNATTLSPPPTPPQLTLATTGKAKGADSAMLQAVLEAVCCALLRVLDSATPQDIAATVWALGRLRFTPRKSALWAELLAQLPTSLSQQDLQGVSYIVWGCSRLMQPEQVPVALHKAVTERVLALAPELPTHPHETVLLVTGLLGMANQNPTVWRVIQAQVAQGPLNQWSPAKLCTLITAYASASRPCPQLLAAVSHTVQFPLTNPADTHPQSAPISQQQGHSSSHQGVSHWATGDLTALAWALGRFRYIEIRNARRYHGATVNQPSVVAAALPGDSHSAAVQPQPPPPPPPQQQQQGVSAVGFISAPGVGSMVQVGDSDVSANVLKVLTPELSERIQAGQVQPHNVSYTAWAAATCGGAAGAALAAACAQHAARHWREYDSASLVTLLTAHRLLTTRAGGGDADAGCTISITGSCARARRRAMRPYMQASVSGTSQPQSDPWIQLWVVVSTHTYQILPPLMQSELASLCLASVDVGTANRALLGGILQLLLGALARRVEQLQQADLAKAGSRLFTADARLAPAALNAAAGAPERAGLEVAASTVRHVPSLRCAVAVFWALVRAGHRSVPLFELIATYCAHTEQGPANLYAQWRPRLLWASVWSGCYDRPMYTALCRELKREARYVRLGLACVVLCLLSAARHYDRLLVSELCTRLRGKMSGVDSEQLACVMWGMANLNAGVMQQWRPPIELLRRRVPTMSFPARVLTLWSLAVQQHVLLGDLGVLRRLGMVRQPSPSPTQPSHPTENDMSPDTDTDSDSDTTLNAPQPPKAANVDFDPGDAWSDGPGASDDTDISGEPQSVGMPPVSTPVGALLVSLLRRIADDLNTIQHTANERRVVLPALGYALALLQRCGHADARAALGVFQRACRPEALVVVRDAWVAAHEGVGLRPSGPRSDNGTAKTTASDAGPGMGSESLSQGIRQAAMTARPHTHSMESSHTSGHTAHQADTLWCLQRVRLWYQHPHDPHTDLRVARRQLAQAMQTLGLDPTLTDTVTAAPGARGVHRAAAAAAGVAGSQAWPLLCRGLVVVRDSQPMPLAVVIAPSQWFARSERGEVLGPLFTLLTLLGDLGWRTGLLDVRQWPSARTRGQQVAFTRGLLEQWRVVVPNYDDNMDSQAMQ